MNLGAAILGVLLLSVMWERWLIRPRTDGWRDAAICVGGWLVPINSQSQEDQVLAICGKQHLASADIEELMGYVRCAAGARQGAMIALRQQARLSGDLALQNFFSEER